MSPRRILGVFAVATVALLVGALPAEAAPSYPPKPPSISITRTRVAINGSAVVKLTGCSPNVVATVTVTPTSTLPNGTPTETDHPTANSAGIVTQQVRFTTLGWNTVTVTCDPNGTTITRSVQVYVVPSQAIWADQTVVHPGDKVKVSASGYAHNSPVTVTVLSSSGATVLSTTATTDATGLATITLPFTTAGTYTVHVLGVTIAGTPLNQAITITVLGAVMPHTGADFVPISFGGAGLLLAGLGLVLATRRRRSTTA
jgi:LPXTG-motif cell wall-anchored protein